MFKSIYQAADDIWKYMWKLGPRPSSTKERPRSATI